ncbi:CRE-NHR-167 protein [Caenorhabditis remanei]|uniref:CRE-NHR-167 protein n=1 Tax=Caenorhabditis remanei TaxID=31234 RepID=E3MKL1_CAERE|nr:CRE-NHR-167 protein [Caenorhabditis remanei]
MMSPTQNCFICGRTTNDFNYSVLSCNACKVFFRRVITRTKPLKKCHLGENCFDLPPFQSKNEYLKCQSCRFQKCLQNKMTLPSYLLFTEQNKQKCLGLVIQSLQELDNDRKNYLFNYLAVAEKDPNMDEIMKMEKIEYIKKSEDHLMNFNSWAFHSSVITVDYMKKFAFVNLLRSEDQKILLKDCYIKLGAFISSTRAFNSKREALSFPDGTDLLPKTEWVIPKISPSLENRIRCRLVGRLRELNITNEEYLLVNVLIFCNPALLQYCLLTYQQHGPTRFTDLLGLCHVIGKHFEDVIHYYILLQLNRSKVEVKKLVKDGIEAAYKV